MWSCERFSAPSRMYGKGRWKNSTSPHQSSMHMGSLCPRYGCIQDLCWVQVVAPQCSNYLDAWEISIRSTYSASGQVSNLSPLPASHGHTRCGLLSYWKPSCLQLLLTALICSQLGFNRKLLISPAYDSVWVLQNTTEHRVNVCTYLILGMYFSQLGRSWLTCTQEVLWCILLHKAAVEVRLVFLALDSLGGGWFDSCAWLVWNAWMLLMIS
jgi:hypothetical protein